jgi:hypothetical protein
MENVATYSEARSEYTKQLASLIVPALFVWFQKMWSRNSGDKQRCLSLFQGECEEIGRWNQDRIQDEVRALIERSGCDYMEELMTAVFVAHTKVLTAIRLSTKQKKLSITVPKLDHFLHRIFKESARCFWKTPFLFMDAGNVVERQKNMLQAEQLLTEAISTAVRGLLPVKQILKDYLEDDDEAEATVTETKVVEPKSEVVEAEPKEEEKAEPKAEAKAEAKEESNEKAIVSIDTEPSVKFSEYDAVFDETQGAPEMRYAPKEEDDYGPSDALHVDEESASDVNLADIEDLEAPAPAPAIPAPPASDEKIKEDDIVILE